MKNYLKKNRISLLFVVAFAAYNVASYAFDFQAGKTIYKDNFFLFLKEMKQCMLMMVQPEVLEATL